jgi:hypothetical protein
VAASTSAASVLSRGSGGSSEPGSPKGNGSLTRSRAGEDDADVSKTFCPLLVVRQPYGVTLTVSGAIRNSQQQDVLEIRQQLQPGCEGDLLLRAFISEDGNNDGILVESMLGFQLAFLDTTDAFKPNLVGLREYRPNEKTKEDREPEYIGPEIRFIRTDLLEDDDQSHGLHGPTQGPDMTKITPWAVAVKEGGGLIHIKHGPEKRIRDKQSIMSVRVNGAGDSVNVADKNERLIGSLVSRRNTRGDMIKLVQVGYDVDAGLCLCALIAALKLADTSGC